MINKVTSGSQLSQVSSLYSKTQGPTPDNKQQTTSVGPPAKLTISKEAIEKFKQQAQVNAEIEKARQASEQSKMKETDVDTANDQVAESLEPGV